MAGPDLSVLTASVDFGTVTVAVVGVFSALVVVAVAWRGARFVLAMVRGDDPYLSPDELRNAQEAYNEASRLSDESRKQWGWE